MIRRFKILFLQDFVIAYRNALMWVLAGALVVIILVVLFIIPGDYELEETRYIYDGSTQKYLETAARLEGFDQSRIMNSLFDLEEAVKADQNSIGVIFQDIGFGPQVTLLSYGTISEKNLNIIAAAIEASVRPFYSSEGQALFEVEYLRPASMKVPQNQNAVPPLLAFEVIVLGFMMAAVLLFQEKAEGTIRAYRVSPGGTSFYILSKMAVFAVIGLFYGFLIILPTIGFSINFPVLIIVLLFGCAFYTCIGLAVAAFFNNISEWIFIGIAFLMINMTPVISYGWPSFAPQWLTYIPSYPIIFGLREILFPTGRTLMPLIAYLLAANVVAYLICHALLHYKLMREGR